MAEDRVVQGEPSVLIIGGDREYSVKLRKALAREGLDCRLATCLVSAREALEHQGSGLDSVLLDFLLPDGRGEDLLSQLECLPRQPSIVVLGEPAGNFRPEAATYRIMWMSKSTPTPLIASTVRLTARGFAHATLKRFASHSRLSGREAEVLGYIADGMGPKDVAMELQCSLQAVYAHLSRISVKARCSNYQEVIAKLFRFSCHGMGHEIMRGVKTTR